MENNEHKVRKISEIIDERTRRFIFRFEKAMFFCMPIMLSVLITYTYCNWEIISSERASDMDTLLWLIITSAVTGISIFISFISSVFIDYKEKVKE